MWTREPVTELPRPPADWRDVAGWDEYWRRIIAGLRRETYNADLRPTSFFFHIGRIDGHRRRRRLRVLFVGNGITLTGRALAHAGFQVVALDISAVATRFLQAYEPSESEMRLFFQTNEAGDVGDFFEHYRGEGGTIDHVCGDLFDPSAARGPFDIIISDRSLQGFSAADLRSAVAAIDRRLSPNGEVHVLVGNSAEALRRIDRCFEALGYQIRPDEPILTGKSLFSGIASG